MNPLEIIFCPGTLAEGFDTYSKTCLKKVFSGKTVSHLLPYTSPKISGKDYQLFIDNRKRISISGVQEKLSLILDKNKLRLTDKGERGNYLLKPIPRDLNKVDQVPANEHLTMQIAQQVYAINTAKNAMIFFLNGDPAYIAKRFDIKEDGTKWGKEDFATLAGKTTENAGPDFKYEYSYEKMGTLIQNFVPAWRVEIEKYFSLVVFNFLFSNGDAHLKNFSVLESLSGDYLLSPAYDLINSKIHIDDSVFALNKGLFEGNFKSENYKRSGFPSKIDFIKFAVKIGVNKNRIEKLLHPFLEEQVLVKTLINRSFLNNSSKSDYLQMYLTRLKFLSV